MSLGLIQLLSAPSVLPNKCAVCGYSNSGSSADRQYVDFGLSIDWYGAVYFCTACMTNIAEVLGYITPEKAEELYGRVNSANLTITELEAGLANYRQFEQLVLAFRPSDSPTVDVTESNNTAVRAIESEGPNNSGAEESTSEQRSPVLPDATDDKQLGSLTI
jgi:hypothetical protein